ncbi:MAG: succinylglutamate desuccinylase [Verrucomicrobiaceae bacterium]|nr:MAG: succinylglutamate desuccinylase [Verrucomicrobiaceae bacterium]
MSDAFHWAPFHADFFREAQAQGFTPTVIHETETGPIEAWERKADGPLVYLSAGIHGDEPAGPLAILELMRTGFFCPSIHWIICPALNPDGLAAHTRGNAGGIDLNRDYFIRESGEAAAHIRWLDSIGTPVLFVSLHEDWETSGFYFYELNLTGGPTGHAAEILRAVEPWFKPEPGPIIDGHESYEPGWIYHASEPDIPEGWPEAIYLIKKGCPHSFTFETPSSSPLADRVAAHVAGVKAACQKTFVKRCAEFGTDA